MAYTRNPTPQPCACGCGQMTKGHGKYRPGHVNRGISVGRSKDGSFPDGVILDEDDRQKFGVYRWWIYEAGKYGLIYVQRHHMIAPGRYTKKLLHREIMGEPDGTVDHLNGNTLDNRKENLRVISHQGNCQNHALNVNNQSGYRGVSWSKDRGKWYAYARVSGHMIALGFFDNVHEAGRVAKEYRQKHYKGYIDR